MRYHLIKNKLLSTLLVFALLFTLLPAAAWAAAATGTASGTAGYNNIAVSLSGASQFAADATAVQNTSNWELIPTGGVQTILGITKHGPQYVSIALSAPIQAGQTFTINAAAEVFAPGTEMFPSPLDVNITIPTPATGTAEATAGAKDIAVALTNGTFGSESAVETKSFWTLGGDSASENPIASVTYLDSTHATVTLTNNIGASDTYTITATQFVFVNAAIAPFISPLSVTVEPTGPAAPLTLVSAAVTAEGGVGLNFNKELSPTDLVNKVKAGFAVKGLEETPKTITNATLHSNAGGTNNFIQLYLDPTVKGGEVVSLSYTPGTVQSLDGGILAEITDMEIANGLLHPELNTSAPPAATVGSAYTHTLTAAGGIGPYTFSVDSGGLPTGLTLSSTGEISGTPTVAASFTFFVMVKDANQALDIEGFSITVNAPSANVCEIGGTPYATLDEALADVPTDGAAPTAITLLTDFTDNDGISISHKKVMLNLNGKTLTVNNPSGTSGPNSGNGIHVQLLSELIITGPGILNVNAQMAGLSVNQSTFTASENVTVKINSDTNLGLYTDTACTVNFHGDVSGAAGGIYASTDNTITVSGTATATGSGESHAVHLNNTGNTVHVGSAIVSSGTGNGVYIGESSGGTVTVGSVGAPGQVVGKGHGISVRMGITPATVTVYGDVEGASHGISASDDSTITVHGNVKSTAVASDRYGIYCAANSDPSNIIINGNVEGANGVYVHGAQSELTVNGNVTAKGSDPAINVGARASYAKLHVTGSITANSCIGAYSFESSEIVIDGTITAAKYIKVKYADKTIADTDAVSSKADYLQYSSADAFVWIKSAIPSDNVCEIGGTPYATLDEALANINEGETKTITLLKNIDYDKGITLINKKITFVLNGYTLNVVSSIEGEPALAVFSGGCVYLSGEGALNVTGPARSYGVTVASNTTTSVVTVTKATGIGTESKAAHAYNKASLTVLGDVTATGINSFGVHAQAGAVVEVQGNVSAGNQGVCVSDATAKVAGNIQSNGNDLIGNPEGIGVNVYDGVAEIGGNVTANRVGAMAWADGIITIDGMLTAPDYIQFADDAPTAIDGYLATTTKPGYRTYQHATAGTVWVKGEMPASQYFITVQNDGNGTASSNFNTAAEGAEITLSATPNEGYQFKEWQVISGGVTVVNNKFSILDSNVTVKAIFEPVPAASYTVAVNGSYAGTSGAGSYAKDAAVTIHAGSRSSHSFTGWTSSDGIAFTNAGSATTTFTMPAKNVSVTANWSYNGGGGGGSSPSDDGNKSYIITLPATPERPNPPATAETKVSATVDGSGEATASVSDKAITDAIKAAQDSAKKNGTEKNGIAVSVNITTDKEAKSLAVTLSQNAVSKIVKAGVTELRITSGTITVSFDLTALKQFEQAGGAMKLTANKTDVSRLSTAARAAIGSRPVFDLSVQCGGKAVSDLGGGLSSVSLPYILSSNEKAGNLSGVYVDENGKVTWLLSSSYDKNARLLSFSTGHFSIFGIGYKADAQTFTDIANHWAKDDIEFVTERGLFSGIGSSQFSPNTSMTRGMFVTALGRLAGIDAADYKNNRFADVPPTAYYAPYAGWAAEIGIIGGTGATTFAPDQNISRQEMAVIMSSYAKVMGYTNLKNREEVTFSDNYDIASWAKDAVKSMQIAGILMGKDGNHFAATASANRAEAAAVLHRYVDLVIDKAHR